jgi:hypothetical protein
MRAATPAPRHATSHGGSVHRRMMAGGTTLLELEMLFETEQLSIYLAQSNWLSPRDDCIVH